MATLKNLTINDNAYLALPKGTTAERPAVPTITLSGFSKPLGISRDGIQLYIPGEWNTYQGLPDYLKGLQCTLSINDSDSTAFSTTHAVKVYLLRNDSFSAVDLTGYTELENSTTYIRGYNAIRVYTRTYSAGGPYTIDNNSAMYMFDFIGGGTTNFVGAMRYNTTLKINEMWNGAEWISLDQTVKNATGGTISGAVSAGGYKIHTFTTNGTFVPAFSGNVEVLVVGGGGGGSGLGGGGGAGGFVYNNSFYVNAGQQYSVNIGTGGNGSPNHSGGANNSAGNPTSFGGADYAGIVAYGGGRGGRYPGGQDGTPGGSGGGGAGGSPNGQRPWGEGYTGQGHPGGFGHHGSGPAQQLAPQPGIGIYGGGGGGGAGAKGGDRFSRLADAYGGNGLASTISTNTYWYAGGGAGGVHGPGTNYGLQDSSPGRGGGGASRASGPTAAHDGRANSGGGGGGAYHPDGYRSGNGGTGVVIVRYRS